MTDNKSTKSVYGKNMEIADTRWKRFRGLMLCSKPREMLFIFDRPGRHSFHTWFMRFPIDFVFLDDRRRVVDVREGVRPWHTVRPASPAKYVLELPAGTAKNINRTEFQDKVSTYIPLS